jgi:hypothetical protein
MERPSKRSGKEKSCERNPSGVSLVFNQKVFRPSKGSENLAQAGEKHVRRPEAGRLTPSGRSFFLEFQNLFLALAGPLGVK